LTSVECVDSRSERRKQRPVSATLSPSSDVSVGVPQPSLATSHRAEVDVVTVSATKASPRRREPRMFVACCAINH